MRIFVVIVLVLAAVGAGAWYLVERNKERASIDEITKFFEGKRGFNKRLASVRTTSAALDQLQQPNFYLAINTRDVTAILNQQSAKGIPVEHASGFSKLTIKPGKVEFNKAQLGLVFDFDAELKDLPVSFAGSAVIGSSLALNGNKADVSPLLGRVHLTSLKYKGATDHKVVVDAVSGALNAILALLTRVVQTYSVPLDIGITKTFDLQKLLATVKELHDVSAPTIPLNLSITSGAVLLDESGLAFEGTLVDVSPGVFAATVQELRDLTKGSPQAAISCAECQMTTKLVSIQLPLTSVPAKFSVPDVEAFQRCQQEKALCELRKKLPITPTQGQRRLNPLQAFVLRQLKTSPSVDDKQVYALLADLLQPSLSIDLPTDDTTEEQFQKEFALLATKFRAAKLKVDDDSSLSKGTTLAAVRRDFLSQTITRATSALDITANFAIPASDQPYDETIHTDPAPNLNCGNQRACKSDFQYDGFNPPGCPGSCTHQECFLGVCTDIPDIGLCARKAACEADKAGQKLDYERRKAQAQAQFALEKADCERIKATERLGCEINQQWLNTTQSMDLGNVKGSAHIGSVNGAVALKPIKVSPNLDTVEVTFDVNAHSQVDTAFTFTPLNAGHVACIARWSGKISAGIILSQNDFVLRAQLLPTGSSDNNGPFFHTDEAEVVVKSVPPLGLALLSQNPQMALACPVPTAMLGALAGAAPPLGLVVEIKLLLKDEIKMKVPAQNVPLTLSVDDPKDQPIHFSPTLKVGNQSIVVVAIAK